MKRKPNVVTTSTTVPVGHRSLKPALNLNPKIHCMQCTGLYKVEKIDGRIIVLFLLVVVVMVVTVVV